MVIKVKKETKVSQLIISSENYKVEIYINDDVINDVTVTNRNFDSVLDDICDDGMECLIKMTDIQFAEMLEVVGALRKELKDTF